MAERERRISVSVLGDGLLLLCALLGLAGSFLSLYGGQEWGSLMSFRYTPLDVCAAQPGSFLRLAAVFALISLAVWSLPRFRAAAAGGLAALLALLVWRSWDEVMRGAGLTVHTISLLFVRRVGWGQVFPFALSPYPNVDQEPVRLFLTLALALLALALGWAVVRARRWWAVLALTLPPLLPGLLADLYPNWPAFMALSACWCAMLLTGLCKWAAPSGRGRLTLVALPAAALVLAAITAALPREGYTRPPWALKAEEGLWNLTSRAADYFSQWDGPFRSPVTYVGSAEEADLTHAGPLRYSGRTVLRVKSDYDGRLYLRGSSLAAYEDGVWKAMPEGTWQEYLDGLGTMGGLPPQPDTPLLFPTLLTGHGREYTAAVDNVGAVGACVYAPYFLTEQDWAGAGMLPMEDSYIARKQGQWTHTIAFADTGGQLAAAGRDAAYEDYVYHHYLDVPKELRSSLLLHRWSFPTNYDWRTERSDSPIYAAENIAALLDYLCEYDINAPAAPEGVDPVLYFLNDSRRGYCMHYASAAVLMLRTMGIPARYVSGFTAVSVPGRQVDVPDRAAHAWVEVWVNDFGWYPVEVTPAAAFDDSAQSGEYAAAEPSLPPSAPPLESLGPEPTDEPGPSASLPAGREDGPGTGDGPADLPGWTKWAAGALGAALLLWLGQFLAKRIRAKRMADPDPNRAALACYGCLERLERWGGRVDPRALELAQKAKFSQHTLTREELDELRTFVDWERARLRIVLGPVKRLLLRYFW